MSAEVIWPQAVIDALLELPQKDLDIIVEKVERCESSLRCPRSEEKAASAAVGGFWREAGLLITW
jgi:hypothetical protein